MSIAFGFALASARWWLIVLIAGLFLLIYVPTILSEEAFLRRTFPTFQAYAERVPRLMPRLTPARFAADPGRFSRERYLHHREYNAAIGAAAIYAVLIARMLLLRRVSRRRRSCRSGPFPPTPRTGAFLLTRFHPPSPWAALVLFATAMTAGAQLFAPKPAPVQKPIPAVTAPQPGFQYAPHQTLTFSVDWRVFTAGTAVFHLDQEGPNLKITATADSLGAVSMLFPVVDKFQSGFDLRTGCSTGFNKQIAEGRRKIASELAFDYARGKQTQQERNLVKGTATTKTANIPACVIDSLSSIFYPQSQPMVVGQTFSFPLADSMRTVTVDMKVEAREEIKTPAGVFQTLRVQPVADEGVVKNRGHIWIWYTDDARHIPVQMQARLFWGTITFHLQSIDPK